MWWYTTNSVLRHAIPYYLENQIIEVVKGNSLQKHVSLIAQQPQALVNPICWDLHFWVFWIQSLQNVVSPPVFLLLSILVVYRETNKKKTVSTGAQNKAHFCDFFFEDQTEVPRCCASDRLMHHQRSLRREPLLLGSQLRIGAGSALGVGKRMECFFAVAVDHFFCVGKANVMYTIYDNVILCKCI